MISPRTPKSCSTLSSAVALPSIMSRDNVVRSLARAAAVSVEARLLARAMSRRHGNACPRLTPDHPADPRFPAQERVHDHAEPGRPLILIGVFVFDLVIIVGDIARDPFFPLTAGANGQHQRQRRR